MPPGSTWTRPKGGFFVWVSMPEGVDSQSMMARGVDARVAFVPGGAFYADGQGARNVRLSYCFPTVENIRIGVERFADVLEGELGVLRTFGVRSPNLQPGRVVGPGPDLS